MKSKTLEQLFAACDRALAKKHGRKRTRSRFGAYGCPPFAKVHDVGPDGKIVRGETRIFEATTDAVDYARERIPTGEAWVVVLPWDIVATFGSIGALRMGGWLK